LHFCFVAGGSAIKPTPAEMLNGISRKYSAKIPSEAAIGTAKKMSSVNRIDPKPVCSMSVMIMSTMGVMIAS
jgi:hypothetical protein